MTKICAFCGQEFETDKRAKKFCDRQHFDACVICGNQFEVPYSRLGAADRSRVCSTKCRKQLAEQTCFEKYGVSHHLSNPEVIAKRTATVREKYGVDNVAQSDIGKQHIRETFQQKYGVNNISQLPEIQQKIRDNNIEKYGVAHPMMLLEYQAKAGQTNLEKYGRKTYTQQHIHDIQAWYEFIANPRDYIVNHYEAAPRSIELAEDLGVDLSTIDVYLSNADATDCVSRISSLMEKEVAEYVQTIVPDCKLSVRDRTILYPKELDIYLPDYKIAIECNPTVTHNSSFGDPWGGPAKSHNYHKLKTDECEKQGIFLFHIFGYEWTHKQPVIKSMLANLLSANTTTIYARKCEIREISGAEARNFLDRNHRQGWTASQVHIGLFYEHALVSVMSFGKMRATIGKASDHTWELTRFCNNKFTTVVGGASKLFTYFVKHFNPEGVVSFSDRAHTRGALYSTLNFHETARSDAGYVWVDAVTDRAYHRMSAQKQNLKRFLKDDDIDLSKSEKEIMEDHKFVRVFDSGTITWVWEPR